MKEPSSLVMDIQAVAPDYTQAMVTIHDQFDVYSKWLVPTGLTAEDIADLNQLHIRYSQGLTKRN